MGLCCWQRTRSSHFFCEKEHKRGKSQNFMRGQGWFACTWSGKIHAFVSLDRISSSPWKNSLVCVYREDSTPFHPTHISTDCPCATWTLYPLRIEPPFARTQPSNTSVLAEAWGKGWSVTGQGQNNHGNHGGSAWWRPGSPPPTEQGVLLLAPEAARFKQLALPALHHNMNLHPPSTYAYIITKKQCCSTVGP